MSLCLQDLQLLGQPRRNSCAFVGRRRDDRQMPRRHTASQRARQTSPRTHAHSIYLRDRGAVPLTGGGLMHHPLGKELFQAHVIIQDHLQERALGGGESDGLPKGGGLVEGRLASS